MAKQIQEKGEKVLDFHKIAAIMQKNFIVLVRDKTRIIPLLLFPIFMITVFGFTSGNTPKHIPTAIVVADNSPLSQQLQQDIAGSDIFSIKRLVGTEAEAKKLLDSGTVRVIVEIPPGLGEDVESSQQASVTVIVDESDSSIAVTAQTTLSKIISVESNKIAAQKIISFQQAVGNAGGKLQAEIASQPDSYGVIAADTIAAQSLLVQSKQLTDRTSQALLLSIPPPAVYVVQSPSSANAKDTMNLTANSTYVEQSAAAGPTEAQAAIMQQSSSLVAAASANIGKATVIAAQADSQVKASKSEPAYSENVAVPLYAIHAFATADANTILRPLSYDQKPGYGTGKRPIDFLIPSIIALTIFQGAAMGMGRAVAGEKRDGSLTRVFLTPTSNATIIMGTIFFYVIFEMFRAAFLIGVSMLLFNIQIEGSILIIVLILMIFTGISISIGMILSSMVKTEQQYMGMAMLVSMPSMFLAGVFFPLQAMPKLLQLLAQILPITYAGEALRSVMIKGFGITGIISPLLILLLFLSVLLFTVFMVFKRDIE